MKDNILVTAKISHLFLTFVLSSVISMVLVGIQSMVDGVFLGNYESSNAMASVNIASPYTQLILGCCFVLCTGTLSYLGRTLGKKDIEKAKNIFKTATVSVIVISCLLLLLGLLFHRSIARLLGANQVLLDDTSRYILTLAFFAPVISLMILCGFMERLIERPNVYLAATICCLIGNVLMNYLFVKALHLGVTGAALATGLSYLLGLLIVIQPFLSKNAVINIYDGCFGYKTLKNIICNGSSEGVNYLATALMLFLFNRAFMNYAGENGVAAFTVINYIGNFATTVMFGISDGIGSIISCNYGAGKGGRVAKTLYTALTINFLLGIGVLCLLYFHSSNLINVFVSNNGQTKELAIQGTKIYAIGFLFNGYNIVMSGYHTSIGNALISALIAAGRGIFFIAAGISIFPFFAGLSGVWFTFPFAEISTFICCFGIGAIKRLLIKQRSG